MELISSLSSKVGSENQEKFQIEYQAGKYALERGQYRLSVQHLEKASQLVALPSRLGGEANIWLVTAYQAAGMQAEAIALCKQLCKHPHSEIRKQSKHLLYIIEAPQLKRPREWMTEIPDLGALSDSEPKYRRGSGLAKQSQSSPGDPIDLSQVNTKDNQFIWVALLVILLTFGGLIWLS
ncbi:MAG: tetratricopeptide repeat protein [Xenococcaceae cyanobacterium]